jgi:PIN domain nuclease of toxin-antitoxin system
VARGGSRGRSEEAALTVLDASALVAALAGEPAGEEVDAILRRRPPPSISAVNLAEVVDTLVRVMGRDPGAVRDSLDWLIVGGLEVEPVWLRVARLAASLRVQHYHRAEMPLSLADCFCLATAMTLESDLATTDPDLARLARDMSVDVIGLPDSTGRRP